MFFACTLTAEHSPLTKILLVLTHLAELPSLQSGLLAQQAWLPQGDGVCGGIGHEAADDISGRGISAVLVVPQDVAVTSLPL